MAGDYLGQIYRDCLSDYGAWEQKEHAREWILLAKNMGLHLSIDECMYCGELYTFVSNKDAHGGQGTVIAIIRGVKARTVLKWLRKLPEDARNAVIDISMDFSDSMKLTGRAAFPNARISIDRFHVMQDLMDHLMDVFAGVRKKVNIQLKHERAAFYKLVDQHAKRRKEYREKRKSQKKRRKGRKRGRKVAYRKQDYVPSTMKNGETKPDFLRRSFHTLRQNPDKWSDEQHERMALLFEEFPELKEAFDLKEEFRQLYWSKRDNALLKDKVLSQEQRNVIKEKVRLSLHVWYEHVKASSCKEIKTFMITVKEREEDLLGYYDTFVTNASAESLNSKIKAFRSELHGVSSLPFFFYRVCKIFG
ncbi:MAG: transposase [Prevotella sp.]|nr:transposase [Prevotella sp.]